jgi:hypothetical protein
MEHKFKEGTIVQHAGKQWTITEIAEDNEGQVVYHMKSGDEVGVLKESDLPIDVAKMIKQS